MNTITCEEVYRQLKEVENICSLKGQIRFKLSDVDIIVKQRDVVGNIIQEWVAGWFKSKDIFFAVNENTQMPPDFYLSPDCKTENMLEVKAFNYETSPGIWFSKSAKKAGKFYNFRSLEDFISALVETVYQNPKTHNEAGGWLREFLASYKRAYKVKLKIPKWEDIEDDYLR